MTPAKVFVRRVTFALSLILMVPVAAWAQGYPRSVHFDPSVRAAGMAGSSNAVFWGGDTNDWSNPALLGYQSGFLYRWSHTPLIPEITSDIKFDSNRASYGWGGIGIGWSSLKLSYGESEGVDEGGNPTGSFESFERVRPLSVGVSVSTLVDALTALRGGEAPAITRYADVAVGYAHKDIHIELAPSAVQGVATTDANDYGVLARVSPLPVSADRPSLELSYGYSVLNSNDASIQFPFADIASPVFREYHNGVAIHVGLPTSEAQRKGLSGPLGGWIATGMNPLLSIGVAMDFLHYQYGSTSGGFDSEQYGFEVEILRVLSARFGHVSDRVDDFDGTTYGFGAGIPFGGFSGVRYDFASSPQPGGNDPLHRHAITAWFDPVAFARR